MWGTPPRLQRSMPCVMISPVSCCAEWTASGSTSETAATTRSMPNGKLRRASADPEQLFVKRSKQLVKSDERVEDVKPRDHEG